MTRRSTIGFPTTGKSHAVSNDEWEEEQRRHEEFNHRFEAEQAQRKLDRKATETIWSSTFFDEGALDDMPLSQLMPIATFGFAAMIGELNEDIRALASDTTVAASHEETFNRLLGNLRTALHENAELIDPALDRLSNELAELAEQYPEVSAKCADLSRRIEDFPSKIVASAKLGGVSF